MKRKYNQMDNDNDLSQLFRKHSKQRCVDKYEIFNIDMVKANPMEQNISSLLRYWNASFDPISDEKTKFHDRDSAMNGRYIIMLMSLVVDIESEDRGSRVYFTPFPMITREMGFSERPYGFIDADNNLCIITDSYDPEMCGNETFENTEIDFKVYKKTQRNAVIDIGYRILDFHRQYIAIMRLSKSDFFEKYKNCFWRYYTTYFFETICNQYQSKSNKDLFEVMKCGHRFLPNYESTLNWYHCNINILRTKYVEIAEKIIDDPTNLDKNVAITLFAVTFTNYSYHNLQKILAKSKLHSVSSIILDMTSRSVSNYPIDGIETFDFTILRQLEIDNLERNGSFILNPFKYTFLTKDETSKLKQMMLRKYPIVRDADMNDVWITNSTLSKWNSTDDFNWAISKHLYRDVCKGSWIPAQNLTLLTKQEIMECIDLV